MPEFIIHRRWRLLPNVNEEDPLSLIAEDIKPRYSSIESCRRLGLIRLHGGQDFITTQHWVSEEDWQACVNSPEYDEWMNSYKPVLERWNRLVEFECEWLGEELLTE